MLKNIVSFLLVSLAAMHVSAEILISPVDWAQPRVVISLDPEFTADDSIVPNESRVKRGEGREVDLTVNRPYFNHPSVNSEDTYRQVSWENNGFTIKSNKTHQSELDNIEGLQTWMKDVLGEDDVKELMSSLKPYNRVDVRYFSLSPESVVEASKNNFMNTDIEVCITVFSQEYVYNGLSAQGNDDFCGSMRLTRNGERLSMNLDFSRWKEDGNFFTSWSDQGQREVAKILFPAAKAALMTTYSDPEHISALIKQLDSFVKRQ